METIKVKKKSNPNNPYKKELVKLRGVLKRQLKDNKNRN
jgi:hypothetical protein